MNPGALVAERFEVLGLARSGGMGSVYRAKDRLTGQAVALKTTNPDGPFLAERFAREALVLSDLRHPAIVKYVAHGETPSGELYLAMEWLEGEDLSDRIARGPMTVEESVVVGIRIAQGLSAAHERGLVHRDVKPSNVFLPAGDVERAKVLDFGIVRARAANATRTGIVLGTPGYMAPEQARGQAEVDARADVFALGAVLFECLTGRPLFLGADLVAVQVKIVLEEPPPIRSVRADVPSGLERLLARMLSKDPNGRPADGAEVARALADIERSTVRTAETTRSSRGSTASSQSLTTGEQRILCVLMAKPVARNDVIEEDAPTVAAREVSGSLEALQATARAYGGRLEPIANGAIVVPLEGTGAATDQAARAARCALNVRSLLPEAPMAFATGRGESSNRVPVGEVIDRVSLLLARAERADPRGSGHHALPPIYVDELTAGLLGDRFEIAGEGKVLELRGARDSVQGGRTLLGKTSPFVGRARELSALDGILEQCIGEELAQAVLLEGAEGLGKSRLRHEFVRRCADRDDQVDVWIGRGDPMSVGAPFAMLAQALRGGLGILEQDRPEVRREKLRARAARHVARRDADRVATFLGELVGVPCGDPHDVQLQAARTDPVLMGDQMRRAFEDFVAAECAAHPLVLVLEDLHWGDLPTVQFVDAALRNLADRPFMVLALARPSVHQLFPSLWPGRPFTTIQLSPLSKKASVQLVRSILGDAFSEEQVVRLVDRAAGNAFFLEELIRAAAERRDDFPETVLAMAHARLDALPPPARRVLRAASVFGQVFDEGGVAALTGVPPGDGELAEWLAFLVEAEVIGRKEDASVPGERAFVFRHALFRDAAYGMLIENDRVLGHRLAGEWLERTGERNALVLAEHFERGACPDHAAGWFRRAAEQALEGNEYRAVLSRVERGISAVRAANEKGTLPDATARHLDGAFHLLAAEAHRWMADYAQTEAEGLRAMELLEHGCRDWLDAAGDVVIASSLRGDADRLIDVSKQLAELPLRVGLIEVELVAWSRATAWLLRHGIHDLAAQLFDRIEEGAQRIGHEDPAVMARVHYARANRALYDGDLGEYLRLSELAADAFDRAGMVRNLCVQQKSVALAQIQLGLHRRAEETVRVALVEAERLGMHDNAADIRDLLGLSLLHQGRVDDALEWVERSARESASQGARWAEGRARTTLAKILLRRGDLDRAETEARAAASGLEKMPNLHAAALAVLGRVLVARGRSDEALAATSRASERLAALAGSEHEVLVRLARVEALRAAERTDEADAALADAKSCVLARAERIRDASHRESFCTAVPENARVLTM